MFSSIHHFGVKDRELNGRDTWRPNREQTTRYAHTFVLALPSTLIAHMAQPKRSFFRGSFKRGGYQKRNTKPRQRKVRRDPADTDTGTITSVNRTRTRSSTVSSELEKERDEKAKKVRWEAQPPEEIESSSAVEVSTEDDMAQNEKVSTMFGTAIIWLLIRYLRLYSQHCAKSKWLLLAEGKATDPNWRI